jgi:hypothetical protein
MAVVELSLRALMRNAWVVAGLLLLGIGLGDVVVGRTKLAQYQEGFAHSAVTPPRDPSVLFPKSSEVDEQRAVAHAKVGFYNVLFLAGQIMTFTGLVLLVFGLVQLRRRDAPTASSALSR